MDCLAESSAASAFSSDGVDVLSSWTDTGLAIVDHSILAVSVLHALVALIVIAIIADALSNGVGC